MRGFKKGIVSGSGMTAIGLHQDGVSLVSVACGNGKPGRVTEWEYRPWSYGEPLENVLTKMAHDFKLHKRNCTTYLEPSEYRIVLAEVPDVPENEVKEALRWRIKDSLDFDVTTATLETFPFPGAWAGNESRQTYVVAAQTPAIQRRIKLIEGANINLQCIDVPEMVMRNLAAAAAPDQESVGFLYFGQDFGLLTVSHGLVLFVSRSLNVGINQLLAAEDKRDVLDNVIRELRRSFDYYTSHFSQQHVDRLVVGVVPDTLNDVLPYLADNLGTAARIIEWDAMLDWRNRMPEDVAGKCLLTLGAALRACH